MATKTTILLIAAMMVFNCASAFAQTESAPSGAAATSTQKMNLLPPDRPNIDLTGLNMRIGEKYICPNNNFSYNDSFISGNPCPEGELLLALVRRIVNGTFTEADIMMIVNNYPQGRSILFDLHTKPCGASGRLQLDIFTTPLDTAAAAYMTTTLLPMLDTFGDSIDWKPYFIVTRRDDGGLAASRGEGELEETFRQACIRDKWGAEKWLDYAKCVSGIVLMKPEQTTNDAWAACAKSVDIDKALLESCVASDVPRLLEKDMRASRLYRINSSPTSMFNCSKTISGNPDFKDIRPLVCRQFNEPRPEGCTP